jgi:hypothetical protein
LLSEAEAREGKSQRVVRLETEQAGFVEMDSGTYFGVRHPNADYPSSSMI